MQQIDRIKANSWTKIDETINVFIATKTSAKMIILVKAKVSASLTHKSCYKLSLVRAQFPSKLPRDNLFGGKNIFILVRQMFYKETYSDSMNDDLIGEKNLAPIKLKVNREKLSNLAKILR